MSIPRAYITRIGIVSPAGRGVTETVDSLLEARRMVRPMSLFPPSSKGALPVGEVDGVAIPEPLPRTHGLALEAARQAMADVSEAPEAIVLGGTTGGMPRTEVFLKDGVVDPAAFLLHGTGSVADLVAREFDCRGPALTISTACSSGAVALKIALELIRCGLARRVLAGGADALCRLTYHGFNMLQLIDPEGTRPLDESRAGMTVGEGAAVLLLVGAETPPDGTLAELAGGGLTCDAYHPSAPHPDGAGALAAMQAALADAGLDIGRVDYINLHGTGTIDNDASEAAALRRLCGARMPRLSSTKGTFGHSLAAAGAVEAVVGALAISRGLVPANAGCSRVDPGLKLNPVLTPQRHPVDVVLSNSFGFGGNNAAIVLAAPGVVETPRESAGLRPLAVRAFSCITGAGHLEATLRAFRLGRLLAGLCPMEELTRELDRRAIRRLKRLPRMTLALARAAVGEGEEGPLSVFLGTGWGPLSETNDFLTRLYKSGEEFSSPTDFVGSVHNAVAGQVAIQQGATGANVTATAGDNSFEQALFLASLLGREGEPCLVMGADESHAELSPRFDSDHDPGQPADGGGALLAVPLKHQGSRLEAGEVTVTPLFVSERDDCGLDSLVELLGGAESLFEQFGAWFVNAPGPHGRGQLEKLLGITGFDGPVVDIRRVVGRFATASAPGAVLAVDALHQGVVPGAWTGRGDVSLQGRQVLLVSLGEKIYAFGVRR